MLSLLRPLPPIENASLEPPECRPKILNKMRVQQTTIVATLGKRMVEAEGSESAEVTQSTPKSGTLEAMLPPVSAGKRDVLHKK
eukprot:gene20993-25188_t